MRNDISKKIIGVTGWYTKHTDSKNIIWLGWYCVSSSERGKGFGKNILDWTIKQVKEKGYTIMRLYTSTDPNEAVAQKLYEKTGFRLIGEENDGQYKTLFRELII